MQVTVESTGTLERRMRVELPAERIEQEVATRLKSVGKKAKIKGFRPGKIPPNVVKQRYGNQVRQEVLSDLMGQSYRDAVVQENLNPVAQPVIEPDPSKTDGFAFFATFEVLPEFKLKDLDKIEVTRPEIDITDADCEDMIDNLRRQKATWEAVDRKSAEDDRVIVDFDGSLKGEPIAGGEGREVPVVLGQGQMLPDFEKGLTGVKADDEKTIKVKFPKEYPAEELAGNKADFAIKVHTVEEEVLPDVDDALAEAFDVKEGGLEQFKTDVRENMVREADAKKKGDVREQLMNALLDKNPIEIPQTLVHQEAHSLQHEAMQRMGVEDHSQAPAIENFSEMAERRVRLSLLVSQLIADQELKVDDDKVRAHVEEMCAGYENADDMVNLYMSNPQFLQQVQPVVLEQQAFDWLLENGKSSTKKVAFREFMNP